ncbi:hypothetical protein ISE67_16245 [Pseudomonas aeruginosa]|nr:hypothetical protein [Pseudomonas aeruginosa]
MTTITVRSSTGTYVARALGHKTTASCTHSPRIAAERLAEKLGVPRVALELQERQDNRWIFQAVELKPGPPSHFVHLCPDCGRTHLVRIERDAPHPYCCSRQTLFIGHRNIDGGSAHES